MKHFVCDFSSESMITTEDNVTAYEIKLYVSLESYTRIDSKNDSDIKEIES